MKVSIIIPAYNAEKYILKVLESATRQTLQEKEVIVIVDGATDNTLSIVQEYALTHLEVKYKYIQNSGLSVARNTGVEMATGEYIAFLDSDDYFAEDNVVETFYDLSKQNNLDVIRGAYKIYSEETNDFIPHYAPKFPMVNQVLTGKQFLCDSIKYQFNEVIAWLGLFKREFLQNNSIEFIKGIYYEDQPYFLKVLLTENVKIMQTDIYYYVYLKRANTITSSLTFKHAQDMAFAVQEELKLINSLNLDKVTKKGALCYISSSFYQITSIYGRIDKSLRKKCVKLLPLKTRFKLMCNSYNSYHFKKIFLFNFCRIILNIYYNRNI